MANLSCVGSDLGGPCVAIVGVKLAESIPSQRISNQTTAAEHSDSFLLSVVLQLSVAPTMRFERSPECAASYAPIGSSLVYDAGSKVRV